MLKFRSISMKTIGRMAAVLCFGATAACPVGARADETPSLDVMEAISVADEAYTYGYPLVT